MIPTPRCVVFYNGKEKRPAVEVIKLSDSFENHMDKPELELICTVYNINSGCDNGLLEKCRVLNEYTIFVEKVRFYQEKQYLEPVRSAIEWCLKNDILKDFLLQRGMEVLKAITLDMTFERREELIRRDEREEGRKEGIKEGQAMEKLNTQRERKRADDATARVKELEALIEKKGIVFLKRFG